MTNTTTNNNNNNKNQTKSNRFQGEIPCRQFDQFMPHPLMVMIITTTSNAIATTTTTTTTTRTTTTTTTTKAKHNLTLDLTYLSTVNFLILMITMMMVLLKDDGFARDPSDRLHLPQAPLGELRLPLGKRHSLLNPSTHFTASSYSIPIWVSFCRAGILAISCHIFSKSRAFV